MRRSWTEEEDARLIALWGGERLAHLAPQFSRTQASVRNRAIKLGLAPGGAQAAGVRQKLPVHNAWSIEDDAILAAEWKVTDTAALAEKLGRSREAVRTRAQRTERRQRRLPIGQL